MGLSWTPALSVGVAEIDEQHQEIFRRADDMLSAMKQGRGRDEVVRLVEFLGKYVASHFAAEERKMVASRYPGLAEQKAQHDAFSAKMREFSASIRGDATSTEAVIAVHRHVCDWLREHIQKLDTQLGAHLAAQANKAA